MSRNISSSLTSAINAQETSEIDLLLLTLSHSSITTIRMVNNKTDIVSNGNTYTAFPFQTRMPNEKEDEMPQVKIQICNVDRSIINILRNIDGMPTCQIDIVLASNPNTIEASFPFKLTQIDYNAITIEGSLAYEDVLNQKIPGDLITPQTNPGLF